MTRRAAMKRWACITSVAFWLLLEPVAPLEQ